MNNRGFKVGDRVRIIKCSSIEPYELNKMGVVIKVRDKDEKSWPPYVVDMGRPRREGEPENTCWYLSASMIELISKPNQQLIFDFMRE